MNETNEPLEFLVRHGSAVLFAAVFVEQLGVPLPAAPWLLAGGALAATGKINWVVALTAATFRSVLADSIWFYLGKYGGRRVVKTLCPRFLVTGPPPLPAPQTPPPH